MIPLMTIARNFFLGREPLKRLRALPPLRPSASPTASPREEMAEIGIQLRDPEQAVGTLSGGERQCVAIARAVHFGAKVLILDEPTSALGVHQASMVLKLVARPARGLGVIFITHNVHHAYPVGDRFTLLNRGRSMGTFAKDEISRDAVTGMMAGGKELRELEVELAEIARTPTAAVNSNWACEARSTWTSSIGPVPPPFRARNETELRLARSRPARCSRVPRRGRPVLVGGQRFRPPSASAGSACG